MKRTVVTIAAMFVMGVLTVPTTFVPAAPAQENRDPAVLAYDDFNGGLDLDWEVLQPDFSHWSLSRHPGALTITTQDGAFTGPKTRLKDLFLLRCPTAPGAGFESTTCVTLKPVDEFNQAGLVLYNDNDNFLSFVYEWGSGPVTGLGNGLRQLTALAMTKGRRSFTSFHLDQGVERVWLRVIKQGDRYTFSLSLDGKAFVRQDTPFVDPYHVFDGGLRWGDGRVKQVGVFASNSCWDTDAPDIAASFDFFEVRALPESRSAEKPLEPQESQRTGLQPLFDSLHRAIVAGNVPRVKSVIDDGADINAKGPEGATAFHWAVKEGNKDIVGLLLGLGASPTAATEACNWTPLHLAAMAGKNDVAQLLIDKGVSLDRQGFKMRVPLHLAVLGGHAQTTSLLLEHGAEINAKDSEGKTALHYAVIQRSPDVVRLLLAKGADADAVDHKGHTPLFLAREKRCAEIADLLSKASRDTAPPVAQEPGTTSGSLLGTWELASYRYGTQGGFADFPKNRRRIRMVTETHWMWCEFESPTKEMQAGAGGSYTRDGDIYTESIEFAGRGMMSYLGKKQVMTVRVDGDKWHQSGALSDGLKIEEVWQWVK